MVKPEERIKRGHWHLGHVSVVLPTYPPMNVIVDGLKTLEPLALVKICALRRHTSVRCEVDVVQCVSEHAMHILGDSVLRSWDTGIEPGHLACEVVVDFQALDLTIAPFFRPIFLPDFCIARSFLVFGLDFLLVVIVGVFWASA